MPSKTVEILVGTPLEGEPGELPEVPTFATPPQSAPEETSEVSPRRAEWRVVQCPSCQALSYLATLETLPGWTTCQQCGQTFKLS